MLCNVCVCVCVCVCAGASEGSSLEIPTLTCTCVVATLFWLLLTLFIRKLKQVRGNQKMLVFGGMESNLCYTLKVFYSSPSILSLNFH